MSGSTLLATRRSWKWYWPERLVDPMKKAVKQYKRITLYFDENNNDQMAIYDYVQQRSQHYRTPSVILRLLKRLLELEKSEIDNKEEIMAERIAIKVIEKLPDVMKTAVETGEVEDTSEADSALSDLDNDFGITEY